MSFDGLDEELKVEKSKVTSIVEGRPKRRPFHIWTVNGEDHKLKLRTDMIAKLENKYKTNVLNIVSTDGLPPLSVMLTIIQAAISPWEHGISYDKIKTMYDNWCEEGGNQIELLSKVLMPTMVVSGFFTEQQGEAIMKDLQTEDELL